MKIPSKFSPSILVFLVILAITLIFSNQASAGDAPITRLEGENRYATAGEIAEYSYPDGAETVILASGEDESLYDSLAGSGLAGTLDAPILLTSKDDLPEATEAAIKELDPDKIKLLGGTAVISKEVESALIDLELEVYRFAGDNRYHTATKIGEYILGYTEVSSKEAENTLTDLESGLGRLAEYNRYHTVAKSAEYTDEELEKTFVVNESALADSLVIGPSAAKSGSPLLLVQENEIPEETEEFLTNAEFENLNIIGGKSVVSEDIEDELSDMVEGEVERISGENRYDTSQEVSSEFFDEPEIIMLGNGDTLVDAIPGGYLGAKLEAPLIYTTKEEIPQDSQDYIDEVTDENSSAYLLGGSAVIGSSVVEDLKSIIKGRDDLESRGGERPSQEETSEYGEYLCWWDDGVQQLYPRGATATVTDVATGLTFQVKRRGGTNHADSEPLTSGDTAVLREIYGGDWSWNRRAIIVSVNGRDIAASMNGMPHGGQNIHDNNFPGHICIHFKNSKAHSTNSVCERHQSKVKEAAGLN